MHMYHDDSEWCAVLLGGRRRRAGGVFAGAAATRCAKMRPRQKRQRAFSGVVVVASRAGPGPWSGHVCIESIDRRWKMGREEKRVLI